MKEIKEFGWYKLDGKDLLLVGDDYKGSPIICWKYDILIGSKEVIDKYKDALIPKHYKNHQITIRYI